MKRSFNDTNKTPRNESRGIKKSIVCKGKHYESSGTQFIDNMDRRINGLLDRSSRKKNQRYRFQGSVY